MITHDEWVYMTILWYMQGWYDMIMHDGVDRVWRLCDICKWYFMLCEMDLIMQMVCDDAWCSYLLCMDVRYNDYVNDVYDALCWW